MILQSKARIDVVINRVDEDDYIRINLSLIYGIIKYKYEIPYLDILLNREMRPGIKVRKRLSSKKKKGRTETNTSFGTANLIETYKSLKAKALLYGRTIRYISSKISIDSIKWYTEIGAGEANITAFAVGVMWLFTSNVLGFLQNKKAVKVMDVDVVPNYSKGIFQINLHCIIRIKIANIIIAGIRIGLILLKKELRDKGSEGNERTSYSRFDENYNG